jgi:hypothetical protein
MTTDLDRLRANPTLLDGALADLELELVDDPRWAAPSDTSYLNERDRADPDVMANIEAMAETNALIDWFGRDFEGFVGVWRGPTGREGGPIVRLDSEGQYRLRAATVGDYLAIEMPPARVDRAREALRSVGFEVGASEDEIFNRLDAFDPDDDPQSFRHARYNEGRARRGLPPIPE